MEFKEAEIKSRIIQSMSHPVRLIMVDFLSDGEKTFSQIKSLFNYDKSTVSKHLSVLKSNGIISSKRDGVDMIYKLEMCCFPSFLKCIDSIIEHNVEVQSCCIK